MTDGGGATFSVALPVEVRSLAVSDGRRRLTTYCDVVVDRRVDVLVDIRCQRRVNYKFIAQSTILMIISHAYSRIRVAR